MKNQFLIALVILIILLLFATAAGRAFAADDVMDRLRYDVAAERVFVGTVHERPSQFEGRMYFTLWTATGMIAVEIGPKEFVQCNAFRLERGQVVTVVGMPVVVGIRDMVLAREITRNGRTLVIRDRNGQPVWDPDRPVQMDPELETGFPVC
jgi:hypothetical protein